MANSWNHLYSPTVSTSILTDSNTLNVFNTTATTVYAFGAANTLTIGYTGTASSTTNFLTNTTASGNNKTINIGTGGASGSVTSLNLGSASGNSFVTANGTLIAGINGNGVTPSTVSLAGCGIVWNKDANATGATYFQNYRQGGSGGFYFELYNTNSMAPTLVATPLSIDGSGNSVFSGTILSSSASAGLGYTTGAGGTVTQATSKTTGVTLNKISGQITMSNSSLAPGVAAAFQLTNSTIGVNDVVSVTTTGTYNVRYFAIADTIGSSGGSCYIRVQNDGGTTQSEAVKVNFTVIKGAIS